MDDAASAAAVIEDPSWSDSVEQRTAADVRVSTFDALRGISPAAFAWWFANMTARTYQDFHPRDHAGFAWTRGKRPGEYVGATHRTHHRYGGTGPVLRSEITFVPPEELFPPDALARLGGGYALAAIVHPLDEDDRPLPTPSARMAHVVLPRDYGSELRCRWWLAVTPDTDLELVTTGRIRHVHEEFRYLQDFLPALYAEAVGSEGLGHETTQPEVTGHSAEAVAGPR